jgi:hypothetical protein
MVAVSIEARAGGGFQQVMVAVSIAARAGGGFQLRRRRGSVRRASGESGNVSIRDKKPNNSEIFCIDIKYLQKGHDSELFSKVGSEVPYARF